MSFQSQLKDHLGDYKISNLGILEDGFWRSKPYRHILPEELYKLNILETIRDEFWDYFETRQGPNLHKDFHHLNSSQAMCFNLFFPLFNDKSFQNVFLSEILGCDDTGIVKQDFEVVIEEEEGTNFDFFSLTFSRL